MSIESNNYSDYEDFEPSEDEYSETNSENDSENDLETNSENDSENDLETNSVEPHQPYTMEPWYLGKFKCGIKRLYHDNYDIYINEYCFTLYLNKNMVEVYKAPESFYNLSLEDQRKKIEENIEKNQKFIKNDRIYQLIDEIQLVKNKMSMSDRYHFLEIELELEKLSRRPESVSESEEYDTNNLDHKLVNLRYPNENGEIVYHYQRFPDGRVSYISKPGDFICGTKEEELKKLDLIERLARRRERKSRNRADSHVKAIEYIYKKNNDEKFKLFNELMGEIEGGIKNTPVNENEKLIENMEEINLKRCGNFKRKRNTRKAPEKTKKELVKQAKDMGFIKLSKKTKEELKELIGTKNESLRIENESNKTKTKKELMCKARELGYKNLQNIKKEELIKLIESGRKIKKESKKDIIERVKELGYKNLQNFKKEELEKITGKKKEVKKVTKNDIMKKAKELGIKNVKNKTRNELEGLISEHEFKNANSLENLHIGKSG